MAHRPVIGLSAYLETARWGAWEAPASLLPARYADQVTAAGGIPVVLPPVPGVAAVTARLDGLVLTGGGDIDPAVYGEQPHPRTGRVSRERDTAEFELLAAALAGGLPVLGICRGLQVLNVARGGTLHQHLAGAPAGRTAHTDGAGRFGSHPVRLAPGSRVAEILCPGGRRDDPGLAVPTAHHQAIDRLGAGLAATAWADDGTIEAAELAPGTVPGAHPFVLAVQWHPEASDDTRLMAALVGEAVERPKAGTGGPLDSRA
ncbi:MAG: gamma-glutamyl-gamma-aminobutyrate hydrolase family protein [Nocardiopsaceae bacterium]|jgi:gamma-glutamyl-gamma-aminobutyrate hydrolase PuuD|nr:gamma-glutamyl-gamma-aminobutyrate hydrolase family protein [Nocardiopsaceae bacterium]